MTNAKMIVVNDPLADIPNPDLARLCQVWFALRKDQVLPIKDFFDLFPEGIKAHSILADVQMEPLKVIYEYAGSALSKLYGMQLTGLSLDGLYSAWIRKNTYGLYKVAVESGLPVYDRKNFSLIAKIIGYERLLMPLGGSDGKHKVIAVVFPTDKTIRKKQDWQKLIDETPWL